MKVVGRVPLRELRRRRPQWRACRTQDERLARPPGLASGTSLVICQPALQASDSPPEPPARPTPERDALFPASSVTGSNRRSCLPGLGDNLDRLGGQTLAIADLRCEGMFCSWASAT